MFEVDVSASSVVRLSSDMRSMHKVTLLTYERFNRLYLFWHKQANCRGGMTWRTNRVAQHGHHNALCSWFVSKTTRLEAGNFTAGRLYNDVLTYIIW